MRPHSVSPKCTSLAVASVASSRPAGRASVRTRPGATGRASRPRRRAGTRCRARARDRAVWNGPVVATSASPTRVSTSSRRAPLVNVTTTSSGPTLMSSAWATARQARLRRPMRPDSRHGPRCRPRSVRPQPRRVHPFVQGVVLRRRAGARRFERRDRGQDRRDLFRSRLRARSTAAHRSQRHVPVLARRHLLALRAQHRQRPRQHPAGLAGSMTSSTYPRSAAMYGLANRSVYSSMSSVRFASTSSAVSISLRKIRPDRARRAHHRDLGRRPREREVGADRPSSSSPRTHRRTPCG